MRLLINTVFVGMLAFSPACTYENELEKYGIRDCTEVTFFQNIKPLITTKCAISGCHLDNSGLPDFSQNAIIQSKAAGIKSRTASGNMPPSGSGITLTQQEIDDISCWVDDGAQIN